jgi:tRNA threonylcarbamoyladenosine biosynthesis protein TsaB
VAFGERLPTGSAWRVPGEHDRAQALLTLARRQWALGHMVDAAQALPIYLRDKVALTIAEREAAATRRAVASS